MPEDEEQTDLGGPFWSGTITFGLVSVPVSLLSANRSARVSLRMVSPDGTPLRRRYFSQAGKPLEDDDIVRGYEIEKDQFVIVEDEELERLAPEKTRDIDLRVFVPAEEIDPRFFERAYYLAPAGGSNKAYRLLAKVMEETGRAGIATFVMRAKEYLVAILAENGILRAETLRFVDEVRTPEEIGLPQPVDPRPADVKRFEAAIRKISRNDLSMKELADTYSEKVLQLVKKKGRSASNVVHVDVPDSDSRQVIDLMEMLQRSLERGAAAASSGQAGEAGDLEEKSKAELYERAQELDIPGRSAMSKEELIRAIRSA